MTLRAAGEFQGRFNFFPSARTRSNRSLARFTSAGVDAGLLMTECISQMVVANTGACRGLTGIEFARSERGTR
jgi:hypothetical protein